MANKKGTEKDVVIWVRAPRGTSINKMKEFSPVAGVCHGGDTCICAPTYTKEAGIVLQGEEVEFEELMEKAGLQPRAECFGGNTCIV